MNGGHFRQCARFISVGFLNTIVALFVIYAAKWFIHLGDVAANVIGYAVGLSMSFVLNSSWTFAYRGPLSPALAKFLLVALAAYGMNLLTVMVAIHNIGLNDYIAQILGIPPYTLTSYLASKYLVFRAKSRPEHARRWKPGMPD